MTAKRTKVYRSRPRLSLSQIEVRALITAAGELLSGETEEWFGGAKDPNAWRMAQALERADTKLARALHAAEERDRSKGRPPREGGESP